MQALFWVALAVILVVDAWVCVLFVRAVRSTHRQPAPAPGDADAFAWVFLVPALDEELTIRDSVTRLLAIPAARRHIVVIDDASTDRTPEILGELARPDLHVVRRELPHARQGKAAALNDAFARLGEIIGEVDRSRVIVVVVDADGRLDPAAPSHAAAHFAEASVGGVQSLVRIYNRHRLLTWCQDIEFSVYGHLFQAGRNDWGTAGMGGNGQFNRLAALDDVADEEGPWRDRLTEDQDLGLRLIVHGWQGRQDLQATVDQQGLSSVRALFRQRTRWSQGNLQALALIDDLVGARLAAGVRLEQVAYLLMPVWQGIIGASFLTALVLMALGIAPFWDGGPSWQLLVFWVLAFGGTILGCVAARASQGPRGWLVGLLVGHVYVLYTWFLWPVLFRSTARQLAHRRDWSKTRREPIGPEPAAWRAAPATAGDEWAVKDSNLRPWD